MKPWSLKHTVQCAKCPWRKDVDPNEIPNGYDVEKHKALANTIAKEGDFSFLHTRGQHVMACHERHDAHCLGWLMNQMGPGNNILLRIQLRDCENFGQVKLIGEQHKRFEDTIPEHHD